MLEGNKKLIYTYLTKIKITIRRKNTASHCTFSLSFQFFLLKIYHIYLHFGFEGEKNTNVLQIR